jgi:hypothetical protein
MRYLIAFLLACTIGGAAWAELPKLSTYANKIEMAKVDIQSLTKAVEFFKMKSGVWPANLKSLSDAGYIEPGKLLKDPWGNDYEYDRKGPKNGGKKPDIWLVTPDKQKIGNWPQEKKKQ